VIVIALFVAVGLGIVTLPIARRMAIVERDPRMAGTLMAACITHLAFAPISIWVVDHFYHGITDYTKYVNQGAILAHNFDSFHFTTAGSGTSAVGAGGVAVAAGIVFAIVGVNKLAAFFVFGWLAFISSICFYRAYSITFPESEHRRRYALLIFFLPSLLFWTAGISKETVMYVSMGVAAYGAARILTHRSGGLLLLALGSALGLYVRPQELLLFLAAVGAATLFRPRTRKGLGGIRRVGVMILQVLLLLAAVALTHKVRGGVTNLSTISANNAAASTSGTSASVPYSTSPAAYPRDLYAVLLDPLPITAHGAGQYVAAVENSILVVLILMSLRRLRYAARAAFQRPYVMVAILYIVTWIYAFAALSNLGLIDRERVLMLPFLLVLLCIPISPKGEPKRYPWELSRRRRRTKQRSWSRGSATRV
jgi:hypothetical protein